MVIVNALTTAAYPFTLAAFLTTKYVRGTYHS
jgi:hypothetical protein